jgi:hypothetical protein
MISPRFSASESTDLVQRLGRILSMQEGDDNGFRDIEFARLDFAAPDVFLLLHLAVIHTERSGHES